MPPPGGLGCFLPASSSRLMGLAPLSVSFRRSRIPLLRLSPRTDLHRCRHWSVSWNGVWIERTKRVLLQLEGKHTMTCTETGQLISIMGEEMFFRWLPVTANTQQLTWMGCREREVSYFFCFGLPYKHPECVLKNAIFKNELDTITMKNFLILFTGFVD